MGHSARFIQAAVSSLLAAGCVSVNVGGKPASKAVGVRVRAPGSPFAKLESTRADGAWLNKKNGNTISYLSTCNDPTDPALESVMHELTGSLEEPETVRSSEETFNGREALHSETTGLVDGVKSRVEVVVFKRNNCIYSLSYVGVDRAFAADRARFQDFLDGFQAP